MSVTYVYAVVRWSQVARHSVKDTAVVTGACPLTIRAVGPGTVLFPKHVRKVDMHKHPPIPEGTALTPAHPEPRPPPSPPAHCENSIKASICNVENKRPAPRHCNVGSEQAGRRWGCLSHLTARAVELEYSAVCLSWHLYHPARTTTRCDTSLAIKALTSARKPRRSSACSHVRLIDDTSTIAVSAPGRGHEK